MLNSSERASTLILHKQEQDRPEKLLLYMQEEGLDSLLPFTPPGEEGHTGFVDVHGELTQQELEGRKALLGKDHHPFWYGFFSVRRQDNSYLETPKRVGAFLQNRFYPFLQKAGFSPHNLVFFSALHTGRLSHYHVHFLFEERDPLYRMPDGSLEFRSEGFHRYTLDGFYRDVEQDLLHLNEFQHLDYEQLQKTIYECSPMGAKKFRLEYLEEQCIQYASAYKKTNHKKELLQSFLGILISQNEECASTMRRVLAHLNSNEQKAFWDACLEDLANYMKAPWPREQVLMKNVLNCPQKKTWKALRDREQAQVKHFLEIFPCELISLGEELRQERTHQNYIEERRYELFASNSQNLKT